MMPNLDKMFSDRFRERTCNNCLRPFIQRELSADMLRVIASWPEGAQQRWKAAVPDNALPVFCIKCERRDLGRLPGRSS